MPPIEAIHQAMAIAAVILPLRVRWLASSAVSGIWATIEPSARAAHSRAKIIKQRWIHIEIEPTLHLRERQCSFQLYCLSNPPSDTLKWMCQIKPPSQVAISSQCGHGTMYRFRKPVASPLRRICAIHLAPHRPLDSDRLTASNQVQYFKAE